MSFKKVFIYFFIIILFLICFVLPKTVFAQAEPASGCSGWQADIALRGSSWHHRGTAIGVDTQVDAGFINPSGSWEAPTYIYYGEGSLVPTSSMYLNYTWWSEGGYLIRIYNAAGCYFDRRIYVAKTIETYPNNTANYSITRAGKEICGTLANYTQSVSTLPANGSAGFSMSSLGTDYNLYRGQPGGDRGVTWMTTPLNAGSNASISNYSINYKMAGISTDTAGWTISPLNGATAGWGINNLSLYLDCRPDKGSPPTLTPTPAVVTPTPVCPAVTISCSGTSPIINNIPVNSYYYLVYRNNGAVKYWDNNKTFSTFTDSAATCGTSYEYDVKPSSDNSTPLINCQQNLTQSCACGAPTATPTPSGACVSSCPSQPQLTSTTGTINTDTPILTWTLASWGNVCSPFVQNRFYTVEIYEETNSTTGPQTPYNTPGNTPYDTEILSTVVGESVNSYAVSKGIIKKKNQYYWLVRARNGW